MTTATAIDTREIQARTLLTIAKLRNQHPAEIDPELAEEIATGVVQVPEYDAAITITPQQSPASLSSLWTSTLAASGLGMIIGAAGMWWMMR